MKLRYSLKYISTTKDMIQAMIDNPAAQYMITSSIESRSVLFELLPSSMLDTGLVAFSYGCIINILLGIDLLSCFNFLVTVGITLSVGVNKEVFEQATLLNSMELEYAM